MNREDRIPDGRRSGVFEVERREIELPLANAMHQLDARNRGRGASKPLETKHDLRPGLCVAVADADGPGLSAFAREDLHSIAPKLFRFAVRDIEHCCIDLT